MAEPRAPDWPPSGLPWGRRPWARRRPGKRRARGGAAGSQDRRTRPPASSQGRANDCLAPYSIAAVYQLEARRATHRLRHERAAQVPRAVPHCRSMECTLLRHARSGGRHVPEYCIEILQRGAQAPGPAQALNDCDAYSARPRGDGRNTGFASHASSWITGRPPAMVASGHLPGRSRLASSGGCR